MKEIIVTCPECNKPWKKKVPTEDWEEDYISDSTSNICHICSLLTAFEKNSEGVTTEIRRRQKTEGNTQCFGTGKKSICGEENCGWQTICDLETVDSTV